MELEDEISMGFKKICHHALTEVGGELLYRELDGRIVFFCYIFFCFIFVILLYKLYRFFYIYKLYRFFFVFVIYIFVLFLLFYYINYVN